MPQGYLVSLGDGSPGPHDAGEVIEAGYSDTDGDQIDNGDATNDTVEAGGGNDTVTIVGCDDGQTDGDTLDFQGNLDWGSLNITSTDTVTGAMSGSALLTDGTVVNFPGIGNIICFAAGTRIETGRGDRAAEDIAVGDLVLTRDNGLQPVRWTGSRQGTVRPHPHRQG